MRVCIIGRNIGYTLSPELYHRLWEELGEEHAFEVCDISDLRPFMREVRSGTSPVRGFTVTSPYKEAVLPFLDDLTEEARTVGMANTVHITPDRKLIGHNTDTFGFVHALPRFPFCKKESALVLGTGGASKAVRLGLEKLGIPFSTVSRTVSDSGERILKYSDIDSLAPFTHIINATPVGSVKLPRQLPPLPYETVRPGTVFFDLNYAPRITPFMEEGLKQGAVAQDGLAMLTAMISGAKGAQWSFLKEGPKSLL